MPNLKWHPFAERFPPIEGAEWEAFKESIRATGGNDETVKYRMVRGKREFLDGKNRDRACQEEHLECKMEEVYVPDAEVKDYILRRNVHRRHMTIEMRRAIVAELHADGESTRQIADAIGVNKETVRRDIKDIADSMPSAGGANAPPETSQASQKVERASVNAFTGEPAASDEVIGRDGKTYPARKPRILCDRCTRLFPGKGKPGCPACTDLNRKGPKVRKPKPAESPDGAPQDAFGNPIPKRCRDAYADPWLQEAIDFLGVAVTQFWQMRLADGMRKRERWYPEITAQDFIDGYSFAGNCMDQLLEHLKKFRPAGVCPACNGEGCGHCQMAGLVSRKRYEKLKGAAK